MNKQMLELADNIVSSLQEVNINGEIFYICQSDIKVKNFENNNIEINLNGSKIFRVVHTTNNEKCVIPIRWDYSLNDFYYHFSKNKGLYYFGMLDEICVYTIIEADKKCNLLID